MEGIDPEVSRAWVARISEGQCFACLTPTQPHLRHPWRLCSCCGLVMCVQWVVVLGRTGRQPAARIGGCDCPECKLIATFKMCKCEERLDKREIEALNRMLAHARQSQGR